MSTELGETALDLLALPAKSRAVLAYRLIESLEDDQSYDAASEWGEIVKRRDLTIR